MLCLKIGRKLKMSAYKLQNHLPVAWRSHRRPDRAAPVCTECVRWLRPKSTALCRPHPGCRRAPCRCRGCASDTARCRATRPDEAAHRTETLSVCQRKSARVYFILMSVCIDSKLAWSRPRDFRSLTQLSQARNAVFCVCG